MCLSACDCILKKCAKFADKQYRFYGQRGEGGQTATGDKTDTSLDVMYGSPHRYQMNPNCPKDLEPW